MPHQGTDKEQLGTTVIVADDDDDFRALVAETLRSDGYTVVEARDGAELLSLLGDSLDDPFTRPDIILTDVLMPKLSGLGVLEELRRARVRLPVLMMTGFAPASVAAVAKRLGAVGVLKKPFDAADLRAAVLNATPMQSGGSE
jgi:CheY-like chemotaxis protein